jgi:hypothetical protein
MVNAEGDVVDPADLHPSLSRAPTTFIPARLMLDIQGPISFTSSSLASEFLMFPFLVCDRLPRLGLAQLSRYHTHVILYTKRAGLASRFMVPPSNGLPYVLISLGHQCRITLVHQILSSPQDIVTLLLSPDPTSGRVHRSK